MPICDIHGIKKRNLSPMSPLSQRIDQKEIAPNTWIPYVSITEGAGMFARFIIIAIVGLLTFQQGCAQMNNLNTKPVGYFNVKFKTLGGMQFWTDVIHFHQWRIQRNVMSGHFRLIDANNIRHAWGNFAHCEQKLRSVAIEKNMPPMRGTVVIMLHGLGRTRASLKSMGQLIHEKSGFTIVNVSYASTRGGLDDHADALHNIIARMPEVDQIHFVCHSLGNIVVRRYLQKYPDPITGIPGDSRICRMVMLGPPNQGSALAKIAAKTQVFQMVTGESGRSLTRDWSEVEQGLAKPPFEFGIIAGSTQNTWLKNGILDGDSDLFVTVDETKLSGATDHQVIDGYHGFMMTDKKVQKYVAQFLLYGYLKSSMDQNPIR